jgi:hypothetical protein
MRRASLLAALAAFTLLGAAGASAQNYGDNPPGWNFQRRGIIEMNGGNPLRYGNRWRSSYAWSRGHHRHRYHSRHHHR